LSVAIYVSSSIIIASVSLFLSVYIMHLHHAPRDVTSLPRWLQILSDEVIDRFFGIYEGSRKVDRPTEFQMPKGKLRQSSGPRRNQVGSTVIDVKPSSVTSLYNSSCTPERNQANMQSECPYMRPAVYGGEWRASEPLTTVQRKYQKFARKCDHMCLVIFSTLAICLFLGCFTTTLILSYKTTPALIS